MAWAVTFTDPAANFNVGTPLNVPLHPTQLYESAAGLVILVALLLLEKRPGHFAGRTFWSFAFLYAVLRFVIEFFRGDDRGADVQHAVDLAVHLGGARAAERVHAVVPEPPRAS